ncbi:MAG: hypothetical protein JWN78_2219 [Bacteroidota bacterium]|nr:hypothetical protein [Bacteroidota bacterium]
MKWLLSLLIVTAFFIVSSFFISEKYVLSYRWMTLGMAIVSFIFFLVILRNKKKENKQVLGANISAIILKFILSIAVVISYAFLYGITKQYEFLFFFIAYMVYSVITYVGAYTYK